MIVISNYKKISKLILEPMSVNFFKQTGEGEFKLFDELINSDSGYFHETDLRYYSNRLRVVTAIYELSEFKCIPIN